MVLSDNSQFLVRNRKEIVSVLEDLAKHRTMLNLVTAEGEGVLTTVLEVGAADDYLCVDVSQDEALNQKILKSRRVSFTTQSGVKVRWSTDELTLVVLADGDAMMMSIPAEIERIQRREYFRLPTPQGSHAITCHIPLLEGSVEATLVDLSVGGMGLSISGELPAAISRGAILEGCHAHFPVLGLITMTLQVRGVWAETHTRSGERRHRVGMEFVNLSRTATSAIQRYMMKLESERISLG